MRCLAQTAIARDHGLEEIVIEFAAEYMDEEADIYPWDRMEKQAEFQSSGLKVRYTQPLFSEDEWLKEIKRQRQLSTQKESRSRKIRG